MSTAAVRPIGRIGSVATMMSTIMLHIGANAIEVKEQPTPYMLANQIRNSTKRIHYSKHQVHYGNQAAQRNVAHKLAGTHGL